MSHRVHFFHWIWSTKNRENLILPKMQAKLYSYMGGIIRNNKANLIEIGGIANHVHLLIEISNLDLFTSLIRNTKSYSSAWMKREFPECPNFAWQRRYGSFTVSYSSLEKTKTYIRNQENHHKNVSYENEYILFLQKHGCQYDEKYIFD